MKYFPILFVLFCFLVFAQEKDSLKPSIEYSLMFQYGKVMPTNFYLKPMASLEFSAAAFQVTKQTHGEKLWQNLMMDLI